MAGQNGGTGWGWPAECVCVGGGGAVRGAQAHSNLGSVGFLRQPYPGISVSAQLGGVVGDGSLSEQADMYVIVVLNA